MTNLQILSLFQFLNYTPIEPWDNIESINYELRVYIMYNTFITDLESPIKKGIRFTTMQSNIDFFYY